MTKMAGHRLLIYAAACCAVAAIVAPAASLGQARGELEEGLELVDPNVLRVCADPNNMPFSNEKSEGFENKLAELFAMKLGKKVAYTFFPQATGFVRMTLGSHRCDIIMGYPQGDEIVQIPIPTTRPHTRSYPRPGARLTGWSPLAMRGQRTSASASSRVPRLPPTSSPTD